MMLFVGTEAVLEIELRLEVSLNITTRLAAWPESHPKNFFLGFIILNSYQYARWLVNLSFGLWLFALDSGSKL